MKRKIFLITVLVLVLAFSFSVWGASPAQYLRSRLTILTAKLYQEINTIIEPGVDSHYSLGLLPIIDVNGEKTELAEYLHQRMEEVIGKFPDIRIVSSVDVLKTWTELKKDQNLQEVELFQKMGKSLNITGLVLTSLVTHQTHYTINAIVVNVKDGSREEIELIILERNSIDTLLAEELKKEKTSVSTIKTETQQSITYPGNLAEKSQIETSKTDSNPVVEPQKPSQTPNLPPVEKKEPLIPPESTQPPVRTVEIPKVGQSQPVLTLKGQSPLLTSLLFGFDLGDVNGDGVLELVIAGVNLQIRNLTNYYIMYQYDKFTPPSNDFKILAVDIDGDGSDEIIGHNMLLKVSNNKLTSQQPRFVSRPVTLYGDTGIAIFNQGSIYVVNYQGLVMNRFSLGEGYGKRFVFTDLESDNSEELVTTMQGEDEGATVQVFNVGKTLTEPRTLSNAYGYAVHAMDLNKNGRPEIYLRKNFFSGNQFLYSKIYVLESSNGELKQIYESPELDFYIVDFTSFPKKNPDRLVVGGMYLQHKKQSIQEIKSRIFFYTFE